MKNGRLGSLKYVYAAGVLGILMPMTASAVNISLTPAQTTTTFGALASSVIKIILWIAAVAAILYLLWSGVMYITAGGDDDKATSARKGIINAIIGIVVVVGAYYIFSASSSLGSNINTGAPNAATL